MREQPQLALANAAAYLDVFGHTVIAWLWLREATLAHRVLSSKAGDEDFYRGKLAAAAFFASNVLPRLTAVRSIIEDIDDDVMQLPEAAF
jgi:hypothetical protein